MNKNSIPFYEIVSHNRPSLISTSNQKRTLASLALLLNLVCIAPVGATVYVNQAATGLNDGSSWDNAYTDLGQALSLSENDEIWVASGTYRPAVSGGDITATFTLKNGIAVYGGFNGTETTRDQRNVAANPVILSGDLNGDDIYRYLNGHDGWWNVADNSRHVVTASNTDATAIIDGVEISHGYGYRQTGPYSDDNGGGLYIANGSPTFSNCRFYGNAGLNGGAVYVLDGSPTFTDCEFRSNYSELGSGGGAVYAQSSGVAHEVRFENSHFSRNAAIAGDLSMAGSGGAIAGYGITALVVNGSTFIDNLGGHRTYAQGGALSVGGAILSWGTLEVRNSQFIGNRAHEGGAIKSYLSATIVNSFFSDNSAYTAEGFGVAYAGGECGAISQSSRSGAIANVTLTNVTIGGNKASESTGGVCVSAAFGPVNATLDNSIVWGNSSTKYIAPGEDPIPTLKQQIATDPGANLEIRYSDVQGLLETIPGEDPPDPANFPGSVDIDPQFVEAAAHNLRLTQASPVIDAGDNDLVLANVLTDLDGNARRFDDAVTPDTGNGSAPVVDMGAYEFGSAPPQP